ncbi:hypothetical protein BJX62DRAFT_245733 [Aspergillus germanicus]
MTFPITFPRREIHEMTLLVHPTKTGSVAGSEAVQVYVADLLCAVIRPKKELKAFEKTYLEEEELQRVGFILGRYAVSFWFEEHSVSLAKAGTFKPIISKSADTVDELLLTQFELPASFKWFNP